MSSEIFERGLAIRREVAGDQYVDRALANADGFDGDFQTLVTEFCWGAIWGRDGLPRATRSIVNIAILCALGRHHELHVHVQGAIRNGVTRDEIREVLMQVAVYAGVPAGVDGFRVAREALAELDSERG